MNVSVSKTPLSESAVDFPISSPFDVSSRHAALALRLALRADMALASLGLSGDDEVWREKAHDMEVWETIGELTVMLLIPAGVALLLLLVLAD
jgi:hypothetical protein